MLHSLGSMRPEDAIWEGFIAQFNAVARYFSVNCFQGTHEYFPDSAWQART